LQATFLFNDYLDSSGIETDVQNGVAYLSGAVASLTTRIKSKLLLNNNTSGLDINVDAKNGLVTLTGDVSSAQEGQLALEIARNTDGARSVMNNLRVAQ
jgi:osmotically-inducible protein OsmY